MADDTRATIVEAAESPERRTLLTTMAGIIAGVIGVAVSVPLIGVALSPAIKRREAMDVAVADLSELTGDGPVERTYDFQQKQGWLKRTVRRRVYVVKKDEDQFTVFSTTCSHLGCSVTWTPDRQQFVCPCHGGVYDVEGSVVEGPPPRGLTRMAVTVKDETLYVEELREV